MNAEDVGSQEDVAWRCGMLGAFHSKASPGLALERVAVRRARGRGIMKRLTRSEMGERRGGDAVFIADRNALGGLINGAIRSPQNGFQAAFFTGAVCNALVVDNSTQDGRDFRDGFSC